MSFDNPLHRLNALYSAITELSSFYSMTSQWQQGLDEPSVAESPKEEGGSAIDAKKFIPTIYDPLLTDGLDYVRDLLFSSTIGALPANDIVDLMERSTAPPPDDPEKKAPHAGILALQPFLDDAEDISNPPADPWPISCLFTGGPAVPADCFGFESMTASKPISTQIIDEETTKEIWGTKIYNIATIDNTFSKAASDGQALTVFLNSIPTHEWSRAVPYLDVQFIQEGADTEPAARAPNIYRFLLGDQMYSGPNADLSNAIRGGPPPAAPEVPTDEIAAAIEESEEIIKTRWSSGMEVFTAPQTMVNADERTSGIRRIGGLMGSTTGVIDPFRPFMSLLDMTVTVAPQVNNIIFTSGALKLKLHDKSRIAEISGLTSPAGFGKTFLIITYGWSHPDGGHVNADGSSNPYGMFINSLKTTEHFTVSNSSYSFTPAGEVDIDLKIYSRAAGDLTTDVKVLDDVCGFAIDLFQKFEELAISVSNTLPDDPTPSYPSRSMSVLKPAEKSGGAYVLDYSDSNVSKFKNEIRKLNSTPDPDLNVAAEAMELLLPQMAEAQKTIKAAFKKKLDSLASGPDPWLATVSDKLIANDKRLANPNQFLGKAAKNDVVSLAKAISIFVGKPLQATEKYSEIQFFYGCLNKYASYARETSIASFPLGLTGDRNLIKALENVAKATGYNISLGDFVGVLNNYFFENHLCPTYGFSQTKGLTIKTDKDSGYLEFKYKNDKAEQASTDAIGEVLKKAYDNQDWPFVQPMLTFSMKTCPITTTSESVSPHANRALANYQTSILRVFFDDAKTEPYSGAVSMLQSAFETTIPGAPFTESKPLAGTSESYNGIGEKIGTYNDALKLRETGQSINALAELGFLEEKAGQIRLTPTSTWKEILKTMAPFIDIGSSNTAVSSMNMSNQSGGDLQTINMLRGSMGDGPGRNPVQLPLQMMPGKASATFYGCPLLAPLQQYFIDMRTGTDLDNIYQIFKVTHTIAPGKFETKADLLFASGYSRFQSTVSKMNRLANKLSEDYPGIQITAGNYEEVSDAVVEERKRLQEEGVISLALYHSDLQDNERTWEDVKKEGKEAYDTYRALQTKRAGIRHIKGTLATCHESMEAMYREVMTALWAFGDHAHKSVLSGKTINPRLLNEMGVGGVIVDHAMITNNTSKSLFQAMLNNTRKSQRGIFTDGERQTGLSLLGMDYVYLKHLYKQDPATWPGVKNLGSGPYDAPAAGIFGSRQGPHVANDKTADHLYGNIVSAVNQLTAFQTEIGKILNGFNLDLFLAEPGHVQIEIYGLLYKFRSVHGAVTSIWTDTTKGKYGNSDLATTCVADLSFLTEGISGAGDGGPITTLHDKHTFGHIDPAFDFPKWWAHTTYTRSRGGATCYQASDLFALGITNMGPDEENTKGLNPMSLDPLPGSDT